MNEIKIDPTTINKIKKIVDSLKRDDGWTDLATVGTHLTAINIDFKTYGCFKLKAFFEAMGDSFELSTDSITALPIVRTGKANTEKTDSFQDVFLHQWSLIQFNEAIIKLKEIALDEEWDYDDSTSDSPYPILGQYLKWTFVKLKRENKILYANDYAAFNTGLVDKYYKPIFALFDKNKNKGKQPWHFIDFCVAGSSSYASRKLSDNFSVLPKRAVYIRKYDDVMYDCGLPVDCNWEHILEDHIERIPDALLRQVCSEEFNIKEVNQMSVQESDTYYDSLKSFLSSNPDRLSLLSHIMSMALDRAIMRVEWNYKTAIPVYYPTLDSVNLILPLALNINEPEQISLALVMTKTPASRYRGVTIFTLDMAYSNARLITKPSSDWLIPKSKTEI